MSSWCFLDACFSTVVSLTVCSLDRVPFQFVLDMCQNSPAKLMLKKKKRSPSRVSLRIPINESVCTLLLLWHSVKPNELLSVLLRWISSKRIFSPVHLALLNLLLVSTFTFPELPDEDSSLMNISTSSVRFWSLPEFYHKHSWLRHHVRVTGIF